MLWEIFSIEKNGWKMDWWILNRSYKHKLCWTIGKAKSLPLWIFFFTQEIIEKIHEILLDDPKVRVHELAEVAGVSIRSVIKIMHEKANRKMGAAFANNWHKTPTSSWFKELFGRF